MKLIDKMTQEVGNNRGIAERIIKLFGDYDVASRIAENIEDIKDFDDDCELADYFYDWIYDWELEANSDNLAFMIDLLCAWHCCYDRQSGIGYLADAMVVYCEFVRPDKDELFNEE